MDIIEEDLTLYFLQCELIALERHYQNNLQARLDLPLTFPIKEMKKERARINELRKHLSLPQIEGIGW